MGALDVRVHGDAGGIRARVRRCRVVIAYRHFRAGHGMTRIRQYYS